MDNQHVSDIFRDIAGLLELQGDDPFRVRSYRRAAQTIENLGESLRTIARRNELENIPGIGKMLASAIQELLENGRLRHHEHLKTTIPDSLLPLLRLPSLTSTQLQTLWHTYNITSLSQLAQAIQDHRIPFDAATLVALNEDLKVWRHNQHRLLLGLALPRAATLVDKLAKLPFVERISPAGSLRRGKDMVADINIVMASPTPTHLIHHCNQQPEVQEIIQTESTATRLTTSEGICLSLVAVLPQHFAAALLHHTGSIDHVAALRRIAQQRGLRLTEHGLVYIEGEGSIATPEEHDIYRQLGLPYIEAELREDDGEIEAAEAGYLPKLITAADIRGDLHVHSDWGAGAHSLEDIAQAGQRMGYGYVAICDYVSGSPAGHNLTPQMLAKQIKAIQQLNATLPSSFRLLAGAEVEITADGNLDLDDNILDKLDIVIAAIHSGFKEPQHKITGRLCKAMAHPMVDLLAHPTGRMLGRQETPNIDIETLIETAVETHTCLEINSHVLRLDLPDRYVKLAKAFGISFALGSDAHTIQEMRTMRLGVLTARRGWVEPLQLLNTLSYQKLIRRLQGQDTSNVI
jgi:DNA polymerase (family 10)